MSYWCGIERGDITCTTTRKDQPNKKYSGYPGKDCTSVITYKFRRDICILT